MTLVSSPYRLSRQVFQRCQGNVFFTNNKVSQSVTLSLLSWAKFIFDSSSLWRKRKMTYIFAARWKPLIFIRPDCSCPSNISVLACHWHQFGKQRQYICCASCITLVDLSDTKWNKHKQTNTFFIKFTFFYFDSFVILFSSGKATRFAVKNTASNKFLGSYWPKVSARNRSSHKDSAVIALQQRRLLTA